MINWARKPLPTVLFWRGGAVVLSRCTMTDKQFSLLLGGFIPAVLFGIVAVFQKVISRTGVGVGPYLMGIGLSIFVMGALFAWWDRDLAITTRAATFMVLFGTLWSVAMACVAIALKRYNGQICQIVSMGLIYKVTLRNPQKG